MGLGAWIDATLDRLSTCKECGHKSFIENCGCQHVDCVCHEYAEPPRKTRHEGWPTYIEDALRCPECDHIEADEECDCDDPLCNCAKEREPDHGSH
jgi:hypothetical protein